MFFVSLKEMKKVLQLVVINTFYEEIGNFRNDATN